MSFFPQAPVRYLITRGDLTPSNFSTEKHVTLAAIRSAVRVGIELIQIREKQIDGTSLFELARDSADLTAGSNSRLLINDRFDVALAAGADGVQLTSHSLPTADVRRVVPEGFLIGRSTHVIEEVLEARSAGADFALFGNVFATPGKGDPVGLETLANVCASASPLPVIAVGGIDADNAGSVLKAGAAGYAAIRYLNEFVSIGE